jgi:hypothetical protein
MVAKLAENLAVLMAARLVFEWVAQKAGEMVVLKVWNLAETMASKQDVKKDGKSVERKADELVENWALNSVVVKVWNLVEMKDETMAAM